MIHELDLPMFLWAKACCTTIYIFNKCSHKVLKDKTIKEAFTGEKLDVSHFRTFGNPIYIHVPRDKRMKLEPFNLNGILVGYNESSKAYFTRLANYNI
jgi:hypothetical protein